ncbi:MAG: transglutaminase domain protein [Frankiales bacterium]|nr:transglutaminase domain protein [Frankiales bacterium]
MTEDVSSPMHKARRAGLVALACAALSLAISGKVSWSALVVAVVSAAAAVEWLPRRPAEMDKAVRVVTTTIALAATGAAALAVLRAVGSGDPNEVVAPLRSALPLSLVIIGVCHAATWRKLRDVQSGLVVCFGLLAMAAVFAASIPAGLVAVAGGPAVLIGVRHTRWQRVYDEGPVAVVTSPVSSPRRPGLAATAAAVTAAILVSLLLPFSAGTDAVSRWTSRHSVGNSPLDSAGGQRGTNASRAAGASSYTGGPLDLHMRGELPATPVLRVNDPGDYGLWRAAVYSTYTADSVWIPLRQAVVVDLPATGAVTSTRAPVKRFDVERLAPRDVSVYGPGDIKTLDSPEAQRALDNNNGTMTLPTPVSSYTVDVSLVPTVDESTDPLGAARDAAAWTQLPETIPARVHDLARTLAAGAADPRDIARAMETYLRANERYTLDSPVPARGEDAVDMFLFRDHLGFCEQFASAETVMLRSVGVPARLVSGLADGHDNGAGGRDFKASDLHAWVEFWVPGTGWVSSDPTAGAPIVTSMSSSTKLKHAIDAILRAIPFGRFGAAVLLFAAGALVAVLLLRRRRRPVPAAAATGAALPHGPAADAYRRLQRRLAMRGLSRLPQETLRDHATRLGTDADLRRALTVVEDEVFGASPPPAERSTEAAAYLDTRAQVATAARRRERSRPRKR